MTPWTVAPQAPLSRGSLQAKYWSGLPCPPPGDLPDPGIELASIMSLALEVRFFTTSATWEAHGGHKNNETDKGGRPSHDRAFTLFHMNKNGCPETQSTAHRVAHGADLNPILDILTPAETSRKSLPQVGCIRTGKDSGAQSAGTEPMTRQPRREGFRCQGGEQSPDSYFPTCDESVCLPRLGTSQTRPDRGHRLPSLGAERHRGAD